jgi:hypothetical protein
MAHYRSRLWHVLGQQQTQHQSREERQGLSIRKQSPCASEPYRTL